MNQSSTNQNVSVDCKEIAQVIRAQKPPYTCPLCFKEYKSMTGIMYHIGQFGPLTAAPRCMLGDGENPQGSPHPGSPGSSLRRRARRELTWGETQRLVEVEFDNSYRRVEIDKDLDISMHSDEEENSTLEVGGASTGSGKRTGGGLRTPQRRGRGGTKGISDTPSRGKLASMTTKNKGSRKSKLKSVKNEGNVALPVAEINLIEGLDFPDAPSRESSYYRFVEQSTEDLDENIEYDMDEEDYQWLSLVNDDRKNQGLTAVPQAVFEILLDRLEKECIFENQMFSEGVDSSNKNMYNIDENAVCVICNDGECHNTNAILFCDMCNLAVHQECYGVPYIPEGQWLCRRCIESPSRGVDCALCPNKGGAFKRTLDARWAHVICALWIPEVQFSNPVFLEPIDGIKEIPAARWKLTCYVCRKRMGACIQCAKANCYVAFHVTCAQHASLYMKVEVGKGGDIKKMAYCDTHTPPSVKRKLEREEKEQEAKAKTEEMMVSRPEREEGSKKKVKGKKEEVEDGMIEVDAGEGKSIEMTEEAGLGKEEDLPESNAESPYQPRTVSTGVKRARQILQEKKGSNVPVVNIPYVPQHRLDHIINQVSFHKKAQFIPKLVSYWKLKRQSRNGVPLLRRLQANKGLRAATTNLTEEERGILAEQLTLWKSLRHDLERARLLIELIRKREKLKREQLHLLQTINELRLQPLNRIMRKILERVARKDPADIFAEPVSVEDVPDYLDVIKKPMDFNTMRKKVESNFYSSLEEFEKDFRLVWHNATVYNQKDTIYYKAAIRIKEAGQRILEQAREQIASAGIDNKTGLHDPDVLEPPPLTPTSVSNTQLPLNILEVNDESMLDTFRDRRPSTTSQVSLDEQIDFLQEKLQMIQSQSGYARKRREKTLRRELTALRRQVRNERKTSETEEQAGSPRRHRATSIPRNAEELASHLLHGSLRMTASRQQILSYSGIRLEERASAMQKEEERTNDLDQENRNGHGRLHSSSDSMLLMSTSGLNSHQRVYSSEPAESNKGHRGTESEGGGVTSTESANNSSAEGDSVLDEQESKKREKNTSKQSKPWNQEERKAPPDHRKKKTGGKGERQQDQLDPQPKGSLWKSRSSKNKKLSRVARKGKSESYVESLKKARNIKRKKLQRTEEEEEESNPSFEVSLRRSQLSRSVSNPINPDNNQMGVRGHLNQSNRRLRSMDMLTSESEQEREGGDEGEGGIHSVNGVGRKPKKADMVSFVRTSRSSRASRQSRSKSSSLYETTGELEVSGTELRASCFSDSEIKGSATAPAASSIEDLTVTPTARLKGSGWKRRSGTKRKQSSSSEEVFSGKKQRLNSESSDGGGGGAAGVVSNGMMVNGEEIKPMDLVWAKCRGYPPYPALVIDPDIPPRGISAKGENIKPPSDEVYALQAKNPNATYLVRFFDGRRTWQWLPPEKIELLGLSQETDDAKIVMAGTSKRSVKEAYARAKQWLRQKAPPPKPVEEMSDSNDTNTDSDCEN